MSTNRTLPLLDDPGCPEGGDLAHQILDAARMRSPDSMRWIRVRPEVYEAIATFFEWHMRYGLAGDRRKASCVEDLFCKGPVLKLGGMPIVATWIPMAATFEFVDTMPPCKAV